jgi:23S rRNA pseudouridine1911/1915/1917 synthase
VVEKPAGLLSAPTPESDRGNLADVLSRQRSSRVFVVHRLDLDTSGILVYAKSPEANTTLGNVFRDHQIEREYMAIVQGCWPEDCVLVDEPIKGKAAQSHFSIQEVFADRATRLHVRLETGRTHQIRIHCAGVGHPVLGDKQYGKVSDLAPPRMALHARRLAFAHPITREPLVFERPNVGDLDPWLDSLR